MRRFGEAAAGATLVIRQPWRPRCCPSCGEPIEEYRWPLQPGSYTPCLPCGLLFVVGEDSELDAARDVAPELQELFESLLAFFWAEQAALIAHTAGELAGTTQRRAA